MNIFTKKSFMKKMAILCLFLVLFNFSGINQVHAANDDDSWGGKLLKPFVGLLVSVADGVYDLVDSSIMGNSYFSSSLIEVPTKAGFWETLGRIVIVGIRNNSRFCDRLYCSGIDCSCSSICSR